MNLLLDFDKAGAEWVVVAWVSADANMLDIIKTGRDPHIATGSLITGAPEDLAKREDKLIGKRSDPDEISLLRNQIPELDRLPFIPRSMSIRQGGKKSNHGLNYGMKYRRFALENEIPEADAKIMVELYSTVAYPGLVTGYWQPIRDQLRKNRTLVSCKPFERKVRLMNEWGEKLWDAAYSFIPQSTIVDSVNTAMCLAYEDNTEPFRKMDLTTQTHDSLTAQFPVGDWQDMAEFAVRLGLDYMSPELEYDGRKFRVGTDLKLGLDWGDEVRDPESGQLLSGMTTVKLEPDVAQTAQNLREAYEALVSASDQTGPAESEVPQSTRLLPLAS